MDKKEYIQKFRRCILEYTSPTAAYSVDEVGEDDPMGGGAPMGGDPMGGGADPMGGGAPMGGDPMGGGADPMGGGDPSMGGGDPMGGGADPMGGGDPSMGGEAQPPQGFQPQGAEEGAPMDGMGADPNAAGGDPMGGGDPSMGGDPNAEGGDDEVVDVDDLTDSQEETEKKVDALSGKFEKLMASLDSLEKKISDVDSHTNEYLGKLESEIEKRNPTPLQRMSMRSTKSAPYGMTPDEYMNNYAPENYSADDDNNGADDPQYKITKGDVDDFTDYGSMSKKLGSSFDLHDILGY